MAGKPINTLIEITEVPWSVNETWMDIEHKRHNVGCLLQYSILCCNADWQYCFIQMIRLQDYTHRGVRPGQS